MGRPIKSAETVGGTSKLASVNTALPIGASGLSGNQIIMKSQITGGTVRDTTEIKQKGNKRFRCTNADGTETLTLTAVVHGSLSEGQCQITGTDSAGGTYFASQLTGRHFVVGALGTGSQFAVGDKPLVVASGPVENVSVSIPNG
ncbi:MAG: hypothetical protein CMF52_01285 [Legionellales bacterium]|nr:hypothetical protein [Legionellales bacterium]